MPFKKKVIADPEQPKEPIVPTPGVHKLLGRFCEVS